MDNITVKLEVADYYWIKLRSQDINDDTIVIGQYTKFFGEGFYTMGVPDHLPITEVIVLGKVNTEIIKLD